MKFLESFAWANDKIKIYQRNHAVSTIRKGKK